MLNAQPQKAGSTPLSYMYCSKCGRLTNEEFVNLHTQRPGGICEVCVSTPKRKAQLRKRKDVYATSLVASKN
jgi:hypothetical protein